MYNPRVKIFVVLLCVMALTACGSTPAPPQKAPDEDAAIAAIGAINAGQKDYFSRNRRYALSYEELMQDLFLKEEPTAEKTGYDIKLRPSADAASYTVLADPATASSAARHFFSDQTGELRAQQGAAANAQSPSVTPPR